LGTKRDLKMILQLTLILNTIEGGSNSVLTDLGTGSCRERYEPWGTVRSEFVDTLSWILFLGGLSQSYGIYVPSVTEFYFPYLLRS
jgi:hypothetical protein